MISIRTGVVLAAFVAMGLTSVAEHLSRTAGADPDPSMTVGAEQATPGKVLRLTQRTPSGPNPVDLSPWI